MNFLKLKICGYTISEALVALMLIGVVSAVSVPVFIANSDVAKFQAKYKKVLNTFKQAHREVEMNDDSIDNILNYLITSQLCTNAVGQNCWHLTTQWNNYCDNQISYTNSVPGAILEDGSFIIFAAVNSGFNIYIVDLNGFESPNRMGVDIFGIGVSEDEVIPAGTVIYSAAGNCDNTCSDADWTSGIGCSVRVITGEDY